ncbi:MAG TPA: tRNA pseudouridine(38-40) synthase TruA [Cyclobacteriaceae bacterium]|nr:tRNA pseudouridine(38-40) synthase TruA [Cyclobacteriaceae bacterium]
MRFLFQISYLGTNFSGWQSQLNATGIQEIVEKCLSTILRQKLTIVASGRTDTGVHCVQQFFHVDIEKSFEREKLIIQMNSFLPSDIAIRTISQIKPDASARYNATERSYEYIITRKKDPLRKGLAFYYFKEIDIKTMNKAAALLVGTHDFETFSKVKTDVNHFICTVKEAEWNQKGDLLVFNITANRFLRGMVRAVVGTLLDAGSGKITLKTFQEILKSKDRKKAGMNVPPEGLYLVRVKYPKAIFID